MIMHRFAQWLTKLLSPIRSRRRTAPVARHEPVLSGVHTPAPAPAGSAATFPTTHWLAAGRRLRPSRTTPTLRPPTSRPATSSRFISSAGPGREHVVVSRPRPDVIEPGGQIQPVQPSPPTQPLRPKSASPAHGSGREEHAFRQRLLSLKRLVQLGVYDEGFQKDAMPDQYRHSRGLDEMEASDQE
jgi:hypothetical protein